MKKWLFWTSWIILFISAFAIGLGAYIEVFKGLDIGLFWTFAGFIGLAVSGLLMTIAYGVPEQ